MRILFLSPRLCLPLLTGARIREYYLARALAQHADVTYASFIQPGFPEPDSAELGFFSEVFLVPLLGRYGLKKIARGLTGRQPLNVLNYTTDEMTSVITAIAARNRFDLVHLDSCHMVEYVPLVETLWQSPVRTVYDWHNIESELMRRFAANVNSLPKRVYANLTAKRLARLEKRILGSGFGHVVCSPREKEKLLAIAPGARIAVIENGVDTEKIRARGRGRSAPAPGIRGSDGLPCQHRRSLLVHPPRVARDPPPFSGLAADSDRLQSGPLRAGAWARTER